MDMAVHPRFGHRRRIGANIAGIAVRQIEHEEVRLLLNAADDNDSLPEVGLCVPRWVRQRHEHLLAAPIPLAHIVLDDRVATGKPVLVAQPVEHPLGRMTLLARDRPVRLKAYTNYDNYVGIGTWTKIGLNNTDYNDQGAFDAANNHFVAPMDGTYLFGATLMYKVNASTTARMRGRLVLNGTTEIRGSLGEISATHVSLATAIWLQTMVPLTAGDTVELQGYFRVADGYFAADHTSFWGAKIG